MSKIDVREMAEAFGVESLTNFELIKLLIRSGNKSATVEEITENLLNKYRNICDIEYSNIEDLKKIKGLGKCRAIELKAAIELGKRVQFGKTVRFEEINSSKKIGELLISKLTGISQELVIVTYLDTKNQIIKIDNVFKGTLNSTTVHPRDIFRRCLQLSASKFIIAHNHPSGVLSVSKEDIEFTNRLLKCSELIGCELLDHLIIGKDSYLSLKEEALM
ncbi:RadC family protein [Companilactobacillus sp. DQM5]|uniref:RadC family protein n=1 Tax=Companilactobacillus sp. DQM5 TaxID=3463359 RepID=UPI0040581A0A